MGKPDITTVIGYLTEKQIRADRGYPSTPMPQIRALAVAVNMYRMEPDSVTYKATICVPKRLGLAACENGAALVGSVWTKKGAICTWGSGSFSERMGFYMLELHGRWEEASSVAE